MTSVLTDPRSSLASLAGDAASPFDVTRLGRANRPVVVTTVAPEILEAADCGIINTVATNVLDMLIKLPGGDVHIPEATAAWIGSLVGVVMEHESALVADPDPWYTYLTVHQSMVAAGVSQRNGGAHIDGFQGVAYPEPLPGCHAYLLASREPTVFYLQPFSVEGFNADFDNLYRLLDSQKNTELAWAPGAGQLVLASCYCVHESPVIRATGPRTFVRIEFSRKRFDREENTRNPLIDTSSWNWRPRPIPSHLR